MAHIKMQIKKENPLRITHRGFKLKLLLLIRTGKDKLYLATIPRFNKARILSPNRPAAFFKWINKKEMLVPVVRRSHELHPHCQRCWILALFKAKAKLEHDLSRTKPQTTYMLSATINIAKRNPLWIFNSKATRRDRNQIDSYWKSNSILQKSLNDIRFFRTPLGALILFRPRIPSRSNDRRVVLNDSRCQGNCLPNWRAKPFPFIPSEFLFFPNNW